MIVNLGGKIRCLNQKEMKIIRTFCISDIHGCYHKFIELMEISGYNHKTDQLMLLGDYVDRGVHSKLVVEKVMELTTQGAIALKGNHDFMFTSALNGGDDYLFLHNGGILTIESYCGSDWFSEHQGFDWDQYIKAKEFILKHFKHHIDFLESLPYFYEDDNHIYVHAGLHPMYEEEVWKDQPVENFIWIRDLFLNNKTSVSKTVIFGHTPTKNLHDSADVWFGDGKIGIDGGSCFGYRLNCLEIIDGQYNTYQV